MAGATVDPGTALRSLGPPPPSPWEDILKELLKKKFPRSSASQAEIDTAQEGFADDSHTRSQQELELTRDQLRGHFKRTHIIGGNFHGEGKNENRFTGTDRMNKGGMKRCENRKARQLRSNNPVFYSDQLVYGDGNDSIPEAIRMTAYTRDVLLFDRTVQNTSD